MTNLKAGGTDIHTSNSSISTVVQNYATAYYQNVTDKMFLLDVNQINKVYQNGTTLGTSYYIGQPTQKAVDNSEYKSTSLVVGNNWYSWLRSPYADSSNPDILRCVNSVGGVYGNNASLSNVGARPAFYINLSSESFKNGTDGSVSNPYMLEDWKIEGLVKINNTIDVSIRESIQLITRYPVLVVGLYRENGKLIKIISRIAEQDKTTYTFDVSGILGIKKTKAFLLEDLNNVHPLTEAKECVVN